MKVLSDMPEVMTKHDVAAFLSVSPKQVQTWIADKKLRATRLGHKTLRIQRKEVVRFLERNTT